MKTITNLDITPISELIYFKCYLNGNKKQLKRIDKELKYRLEKKYNLSKMQANILITREKNTILEQSEDYTTYMFNNCESVSAAISTLYTKLRAAGYDDEMSYKSEFDKLTLSELAITNYLTERIASQYRNRTNLLLGEMVNGEPNKYHPFEESYNLQRFYQYIATNSKKLFMEQSCFKDEKQALHHLKREQLYFLYGNEELPDDLLKYRNLSDELVARDQKLIGKNLNSTRIYLKVARRR